MGIVNNVLELANGVFKKWFSKEATQEQRDNKIGELEREQIELSKKNDNGRYNTRLSYIAHELRILSEKAKNSR
jgi:isocitrate dehydrogenase